MSEFIHKFECLRELNEEFKRIIKLFYVCDSDGFGRYSDKINIIVTNDDMVYAFRNKEHIEVLRAFHRNEIENKFIIKELCHQRVVSTKELLILETITNIYLRVLLTEMFIIGNFVKQNHN